MRLSTLSKTIRFAALLFPIALSLGLAGKSFGQLAFYTFTSGPGGDGFTWDNDVPPSGLFDLDSGDTFFAPTLDSSGDINIENFSENVSFFDSSYQAAGNSAVIDGDAWWGNPLDNSFAQVGASFFNTSNGSASSVAFDFAWAIAGEDAPDYIEIEANDNEGDFALLFLNLDSSFNAGPAFGGFNGWEGSISFDISDFQEDNPSIDAIETFFISLDGISTLGGTSEFAIDNLSIDGGGANEGSNVFPSFNSGMNGSGSVFSRNVLRDTGIVSITQAVTNDGNDATTFSTQIVPGGDLTDPGQVNGDPINPGQTVFISPIATLDSNTLSGEYSSDIVFINDGNPFDPDDTLTQNVRVHDPPALSDDSSATVQVDIDPQIFIANAVAGPHAGAIRAGVEISNRTITGPFTITPESDLVGEMVVGAGETRTGNMQFNRFGRLNGSYNGSVTVELSMVSSSGFFLFNAPPVPDVVWNLEFNLATTATDSIAVNASESFGPNKIGVNDAITATTIVDGSSSSSQTVSMAITSNPEQGDGTQSAALATSTVDVDFSVDADLYVLQFTYDDGNLPSGFTEEQMQLLVFDTLADDWVLAIDRNSDGGAGSSFFAGSYADYLAGLGGGSLDGTDLSSFGVDTVNNMAWAVLDHASLFSLGVLGTFASADVDLDNDGDVDGTDFLLIQQSAPSLIADWQAQYRAGSGSLAASQSVPEPTGLGLALLSVFGLTLASRQRLV